MAEFRWFVGIDWATKEHQVAVVDAKGTLLRELRVEHDGVAIEDFAQMLAELSAGDLGAVAVAIETPRGSIIELLVERGVCVFSINPKQLDRFRDRHTVAGAKDDRRDAFVLADSLRTDMKLFRKVIPDDPLVVELRELSRARDEIEADLIALGNRLGAQVHRYFPQFLELGSFYEDLWMLELFELAPRPDALKRLRATKVASVLRRHRIRRVGVDHVLATLRKRPLPLAAGVVEAASGRALMIVPRLRAAFSTKKECDARIERLLAQLAEQPNDGPAPSGPSAARAHRDAAILLSLPGVGTVVGATMLAEASTALAARDYHALRVRCGTAPVTHQSGKHQAVVMRRACASRLRNALHHWANTAVLVDPRCCHQYGRLRAAGHRHGRALRGVGDRLLAMLVAMLKSGTLYSPERRLCDRSLGPAEHRLAATGSADGPCPAASAPA